MRYRARCHLEGWCLEESVGVRLLREQRLDLMTQGVVTSTGVIEKSRALGRGLVQGGLAQVLDALPSVHERVRDYTAHRQP